MSLYQGAFPFLITYCVCVSIQFTIYETIVSHYKLKYRTPEEYEKHEFKVNMLASVLGGAIGSGLTNCFDVLTINKQTNPDINLIELIKKERSKLLTKGLFARVYYNSMQSIVFFNLVLYIGKIYNVELSDD